MVKNIVVYFKLLYEFHTLTEHTDNRTNTHGNTHNKGVCVCLCLPLQCLRMLLHYEVCIQVLEVLLCINIRWSVFVCVFVSSASTTPNMHYAFALQQYETYTRRHTQTQPIWP